MSKNLLFTTIILSLVLAVTLNFNIVTGAGPTATILLDSALADYDFDGVTGENDLCPTAPAHQMVRFNPGDYVFFLGQTVKFLEADSDGNMSFSIGTKQYGIQPGKETAVPSKKKKFPGFIIKGIFAYDSSDDASDEAIVVIRRGDLNISTGCPN